MSFDLDAVKANEWLLQLYPDPDLKERLRPEIVSFCVIVEQSSVPLHSLYFFLYERIKLVILPRSCGFELNDMDISFLFIIQLFSWRFVHSNQ